MKVFNVVCLSSVLGTSSAFLPSVAPGALQRIGSSAQAARSFSAPAAATCVRMSKAGEDFEFTKENIQKIVDAEFEQFSTYPDTELTKKYGHLRGAEIKTVSDTMRQFNQLYRKPILPQYRVMVTEILQSTHLTVVDARYKYDPIFAYGLITLYYSFFSAYPGQGQKELILESIIKALDHDPAQLEADKKKVEAFAEGKTEAEMLEIIKGNGDSEFATYFKEVAALPKEDFKYSRPWGIGIVNLMKLVGVEPSEDAMKAWLTPMGIDPRRGMADLNLYSDTMDKVEQAEQMYKEIEIREKKKMAQRLEEKAQRALDAAKEAEAKAKAAKEEVKEPAVAAAGASD